VSATNEWMSAIDSGEIVGALLIDLSKAFDTVPHNKMLIELLNIGCSSMAVKWFTSYLHNKKQRVIETALEVTPWKDVKKGVPQGSGLSPLLFNIYVRSIPENCESSTHQFADDITHSEHGQEVSEVRDKLARSFKNTKQFCEEHNLVINTDKTQLIYMHASGKRLGDNTSITLDGCTIQGVKSVKLLGMTIDSGLTFSAHIDETVKKCNGLIGSLAKAAKYPPKELLCLAYVGLVRSHLEYSSAVWGSAAKSHLKKLDTVQKIASRIISHAPRLAHSEPLLKSLKLETLEDRRSNHLIRIVDACTQGNYHPVLNHLFRRNVESGYLEKDKEGRIGIGRRRFEIFARDLYNEAAARN